MKYFEEPSIEVIKFSVEDVITTIGGLEPEPEYPSFENVGTNCI